jgi:hypothetical protein
MGKRPINIGIDNQAALALSKNPIECAGQTHRCGESHQEPVIRENKHCRQRKMSQILTKLVSEKKSAYCNVGMGLIRF